MINEVKFKHTLAKKFTQVLSSYERNKDADIYYELSLYIKIPYRKYPIFLSCYMNVIGITHNPLLLI